MIGSTRQTSTNEASLTILRFPYNGIPMKESLLLIDSSMRPIDTNKVYVFRKHVA